MYIPPQDIIRRQSDGRGILLAAAGVPVPHTEMRRLRLMDGDGNLINEAAELADEDEQVSEEQQPADDEGEQVSEEEEPEEGKGEDEDAPPAVDATERALELAEEHDIDLAQIVGTGADGRIIAADVNALID